MLEFQRCINLRHATCLQLHVFKQKTAYEMRISDWSSDVCSSDLGEPLAERRRQDGYRGLRHRVVVRHHPGAAEIADRRFGRAAHRRRRLGAARGAVLKQIAYSGSLRAQIDLFLGPVGDAVGRSAGLERPLLTLARWSTGTTIG